MQGRSRSCSGAGQPVAVRSPAGDLPDHLFESVEFTDIGVTIDASLPVESWSALIAHLGRLEAGIPWWIGDALVFGEHAYGSKYADAVEATGRSLKTLKNYAWVARSVPSENRDANQPWRMYREIARLTPPEQRDWLARAKAKNWTVDDLRRELVAAKHHEKPTRDFDPTSGDEQGRLDRVMVKCPRCDHRFEP